MFEQETNGLNKTTASNSTKFGDIKWKFPSSCTSRNCRILQLGLVIHGSFSKNRFSDIKWSNINVIN